MSGDFPILTPFEYTFDYGKTVEQLLVEGGYDGYVDRKNITQANFPVMGSGVVRRRGDYVHFDKSMADAAVDAWCKKRNKRRGTAHETLTIGAADKELQRKHSLVSGQTVLFGDYRYVVYLSEDYCRRSASLGSTSLWGSSCFFVVFDEEPVRADP